ncbi:MAG: flavodoxin [Atribacterota bacterium]
MEEKVLIAYYSWSGKTRRLALLIQEAVKGELFEVEPQDPYPSSYAATVQQAKKEIQAGYKPPLQRNLDSLKPYEIIFVGSPNWWSTIAPPVVTFLSVHDWSGKKVAPFVAHGGGGMGKIEREIAKLCPGATLLKGLAVYGQGVEKAREKLRVWLREIGLHFPFL